MLVNLRRVFSRPLTYIGVFCMVFLMLFNEPTSIYYYLTIAQLLFVPIIVQQLATLKRWQIYIIGTGQFAVTTLYFTEQDVLVVFCVLAYLLGTLSIASIGVDRFLRRGFVNTAETMIDIGLIYIAMGGLWFLAYHLQINTGFSPLITWLTAIHFHYSAFLLCISVGLIGRFYMTKLYKYCACVIAAGPMLVAIGITISTIIEIVSVSLYVLALFTICFLIFKWPLPKVQRIFIHLAFSTLCFTIIWSFLYAYSNLTGNRIVDIPNMLDFHGLLNCIGFGGLVTIAWSLFIPSSKQKAYTFPVSKIRGKAIHLQEHHVGLVDDMSDFLDAELPSSIIDFYEHTERYQLTASVQWKTWFKPFAFVYQFISRQIEQLNLPFSAKTVPMSGEIWKVDEDLDGREKPRLWQRKIHGKTVFSAIYSKHINDQTNYMNIALPLPLSSMHGILQLSAKGNDLHLKSDGKGDAGTYLAIGNYVLKLPLHEYFVMKEEQGLLTATHDMTIFGIHFLHIDYFIELKKF